MQQIAYAANRFATLLKSHFGMGVVLYICWIFSEHFFIRTPLEGCFWIQVYFDIKQMSLLNEKVDT